MGAAQNGNLEGVEIRERAVIEYGDNDSQKVCLAPLPAFLCTGKQNHGEGNITENKTL